MSHKGPSNAIDSGISSQGAFGEFWKLMIKLRGQMIVNIFELGTNNMKIVNQPLRGGSDGTIFLHRLQQYFIRLFKNFAIFFDAGPEIFSTVQARSSFLRSGETLAMELKAARGEYF